MANKSQEKEFNSAVNHYFKTVKSKLTKHQHLDEEGVIHFIIGLVSLGKYQLLIRFYEEIKDEVRGKPLNVDFMHLFILLASNSQLLYLQMKQG